MKVSSESSNSECPDLSGMRILVVEGSWRVGMAITRLLKALGAEVSGPMPTSADAQRLVCEQAAGAALVDFKLRGGELPGGLVERLHELGIHVIVTTGYTEFLPQSSNLRVAPPGSPGSSS